MSMVNCLIEGVSCQVPRGSVLDAALSQGFDVPHLCHVRGRQKHRASCGLCYVEVSGLEHPVRACEQQVAEGMEISLSSSRARELAKGAFCLILADHRLDCAHCIRGGASACELRDLAKLLGVSLRSDLSFGSDDDFACEDLLPEGFSLDRSKCVLCARCVETCEREGARLLEVFGRGRRSHIGAIDLEAAATNICPTCGKCIEACPAGALTRT